MMRRLVISSASRPIRSALSTSSTTKDASNVSKVSMRCAQSAGSTVCG